MFDFARAMRKIVDEEEHKLRTYLDAQKLKLNVKLKEEVAVSKDRYCALRSVPGPYIVTPSPALSSPQQFNHSPVTMTRESRRLSSPQAKNGLC